MWVAFYVNGRFFCFEKKLTSPSDSKTIIRGFSIATNFYGIFVYDLLVGLSVSFFIGYIPTKSVKKWVYEFTAKLCFVILLRTVCFDVLAKSLDKLCNSGGYVSHLVLSSFSQKTQRGIYVKILPK